jgi:hypothetical protein
MKNELKMLRKKPSWSNLRDYTSIYLDVLGKTTKKLRKRSGPPKLWTGPPCTRQRRHGLNLIDEYKNHNFVVMALVFSNM